MDFAGALRQDGGARIIAEFKPASPSHGPIKPDADVVEIVGQYESAGAAAISVLTEPELFGSSLDDLARARAACGIPILRKDFLVDPYQVDEAREAGADAVLVIVSILDGSALVDLVQASEGRGMTPMVEIHDEHELEQAYDVGAKVIAINQRDLRDLSLDLKRAERLLPRLPPGTTAVAESGLSEREEIDRLRGLGCHAFLIGTHLMEAEQPGDALAELLP
jgi:indole-3-glycerol phosphate synthase